MTPATQAIARDLIGYALGEPDEDRLPDIYGRLSDCEASRRFVQEVREASERLADALEYGHGSHSNGQLTIKPAVRSDPDFEMTAGNHGRHYHHLTAAAAHPGRHRSSQGGSSTLLAALAILFMIGLVVLFASWISMRDSDRPRIVAIHPPTIAPPEPVPIPAAPDYSSFRDAPKSMTFTTSRPRLELPPDSAYDVATHFGYGVEVGMEDLISTIAVKASNRGATDPPEASVEFRDAPWSPKHRLALIRIDASRLGDGKIPTIRVEFNPKHVLSYRLLSQHIRLPWRSSSPPGVVRQNSVSAVFLAEMELNEASPQPAPNQPFHPHDRETLFVTMGGRDAQGVWRSVLEQTATDGPDSKEASPAFRAAVAVAAWRLLATNDPLKGTASPYLVQDLIRQVPRDRFYVELERAEQSLARIRSRSGSGHP